MRRKRLSWLLVALISVVSGPASATERRPLPDFELTRADGGKVKSAGLAREGTWLLLYVQPECRACERILKAASPETHPELADRLVVVAGSVEAVRLEALSSAFPDLPRNAWHADPALEAFKRLRLPGIPVVLGMRGNAIEWSLSGVIAEGATLESVLTNWMGK